MGYSYECEVKFLDHHFDSGGEVVEDLSFVFSCQSADHHRKVVEHNNGTRMARHEKSYRVQKYIWIVAPIVIIDKKPVIPLNKLFHRINRLTWITTREVSRSAKLKPSETLEVSSGGFFEEDCCDIVVSLLQDLVFDCTHYLSLAYPF